MAMSLPSEYPASMHQTLVPTASPTSFSMFLKKAFVTRISSRVLKIHLDPLISLRFCVVDLSSGASKSAPRR